MGSPELAVDSVSNCHPLPITPSARACILDASLSDRLVSRPMDGLNGGDSKIDGKPTIAAYGLRIIPLAFAALILLCGVGCKTTLETTLFAISRVKSPITYDLRHSELNKPLSEGSRTELAKARKGMPVVLNTTNVLGENERIDDLHDLAEKETLVMLCYSGGGARAARMAMHTMAELETVYNERYGDASPALLDRIDVYSTVSGGSLFSSVIAKRFHSNLSTNRAETRRTGFQSLIKDPRAERITRKLGSSSALFYFNPGHFGVVPALLLVTEWDTLNLFARTHAYLQQNRFLFTPPKKLMTLSDLDSSPRFLFNATCVETKMPFVMTQAALHTESDANPLTGVVYNPVRDWLLESDKAYADTLKSNPLVHASTLEDIGSSPGAFPLSYAVMASAAFPFIFNPLHLKKHNAVDASAKDGYIKLIDGGIYDNTGLVTALELYNHFELHHPNPNRKLILISVNADNEIGGFDKESLAKIGYFEVDIPLRGLFEAVHSMDQIYYHQTQMFRAAIQFRVRKMNQDRHSVDFFEIKLEDLEEGTELRKKIREIKTAMVMTKKNDKLVKEAVDKIINSRSEDRQMSLAEEIVQSIGTGK
ncbi:MAG: hypothetical protein ACI9VS_000973 [Candidatus Binatia bacterium]